MARLPVIFLPHGGGPWPFADLGIPKAEHDALTRYLQSLRGVAAPKAVLCVTAHWEAAAPTVSTAKNPFLYYDYFGFPPETYRLRWPAPGDPTLARRVRALLEGAGIASAEDEARGFDHGTFVPLMVTWPDGAVPVVQLSLRAGLDPAEHLRIGRALAPLRDEEVLIVGSGMSFHNLRIFFDAARARPVAEVFDAWLRETMALDVDARDARLADWAKAPAARLAHPREEHLLPLMVIAGAAGNDRAKLGFDGTFAGIRLSAFHFG